MTFEDYAAWVVTILWTITSFASVIFACYGLRLKKPIYDEAVADLAAVPQGSRIYEIASLQVLVTRAIYHVQQAFVVHQSLFFLAGVTVLFLRYTHPVLYDTPPQDLNFVQLVRAVAVPFDLVIAQFIIVIGQVFLHRAGQALRQLYHIKMGNHNNGS